MAFPTSPTNGQQANINGITYTYSSTLTAWTVSTSVSNSFVSISVSGNVNSGNIVNTGLISSTGNVTGNYIFGNGSQLTGVSTGASSNVSNGTSNVTVVSSGGDVSVGIGGTGNVAVFATTGEYITGIVSATGTVTGSSLLGSVVSVSGTVTAASVVGGVITGTSTSVSGNVTGGNVITGGTISATGNLTAGNIATGTVTPTGTIVPRVVVIANGTSVTMNGDTTDMATQTNTQVAGTLTINAVTGTPINGQKIVFRLQSTNVQTFSWNAVFVGSSDLPLPTASSGSSKYDYMGFVYNSTASKWQILAKNFGF
jgi:hypothetical protein